MTETMAQATADMSERRPFMLALGLVAGVTALRLAVLFATLWPNTQAEVTAALKPAESDKVLAASLEDVYLHEMRADFAHVTPDQPVSIPLDPTHSRKLSLFVGERLSPRPRDPHTGLPIDAVSAKAAPFAAS